MISNQPPSDRNEFLAAHAVLMAQSFRHFTGRPLLGPPQCPPMPEPGSATERMRLLFEAPFALVSHNTDADPIFNYANRTALALFEMEWGEFTTLPSRFSAEPVHRDERARLMARVAADGYIDDYQGIRIAKSGRRFRIENAIVWNLIDDSGRILGQAAMFHIWTPLSPDGSQATAPHEEISP